MRVDPSREALEWLLNVEVFPSLDIENEVFMQAVHVIATAGSVKDTARAILLGVFLGRLWALDTLVEQNIRELRNEAQEKAKAAIELGRDE